MKKRMLTFLMTLCMVLFLLPMGVRAATKLDTPSVTSVNDASSGKIKLSWGAVEDAKTYRIYRATSKKGTYKKIKTTSKTSYTDSSAVAGKKYYYKVKAVESDGDTSASSTVVSRVCDLARPDVTVKNTASTGKVKLSWKEINGAEKYVVYRATSKNGEYKKLKTTTSTAYTDSSAKVGKTYYYKVVAVHENASANSAKSSVDSGVRDLLQPTVTVKLNSSDKPKVSWKTIEGAEKYVIYRATSKSGEYTKIKTTSQTAYTDKTAEAGTTYYYKVKAVHEKSAANSAYSKVVKISLPKVDAFQEMVIVDDENCTFKIVSIEEDGTWGYTLKAYLENKTDLELMFSLDDVSVNGFMCDPFWASTVTSGMKANEEISFFGSDLEKNGITEVTDISFTLRVYDNNDWDVNYLVNDIFTIYPKGKDAVKEYVRTPVAGETVLLDNNDCKMIVTGYVLDNSGDYSVNVYLENKTDTTLMFSVDNTSVNSFMCEPYWAETVAPGKRSNTSITWMESEFEKNGITEVTEIAFTMCVYDDDNWDVDYLVNDTFTLYPKGKDAVKEYVRTPVAGETVLFDNEDYTMIVMGYAPDSSSGYTVNVYLENKTDRAVVFTVDNAAVNGYMCDPYWGCSVAPGKRCNTSISWMESDFEENGITEVETITLPIHVYDDVNWDELMYETYTLKP